MPYELWHGAEQAQPTVQAFIFDGWSHEPLVIDTTARRQRTQPEPAREDRKTARSIA